MALLSQSHMFPHFIFIFCFIHSRAESWHIQKILSSLFISTPSTSYFTICITKKRFSLHVRWLMVFSYLPYFDFAVHFHWAIVTIGWLEYSWCAIIIKGQKFFSERSFRNIIIFPCSFQINFKYLNASGLSFNFNSIQNIMQFY